MIPGPAFFQEDPLNWLFFIRPFDLRQAPQALKVVSYESPNPVYQLYRVVRPDTVHDRTADSIAKVLSGLPHCNVTIVPFHIGAETIEVPADLEAVVEDGAGRCELVLPRGHSAGDAVAVGVGSRWR